VYTTNLVTQNKNVAKHQIPNAFTTHLPPKNCTEPKKQLLG